MRKILSVGVWAAGGLFAVGLSAATKEPQARSPQVVTHRDLAYGDLKSQRLDVFAPASRGGLAPVLVFFHGGAWVVGDKILCGGFAKMLAEKGFVVVNVNYRLFPEARFPAFVNDGALAVKWARREAERYGGDPQRLFLGGHSSGAHLAALLAMDIRYLGTKADIQGLIGLAGPYDFYPDRVPVVKPIFRGHIAEREIMPIAFAATARVPLLLVQGKADPIVPWHTTERMAAAAQSAGAKVQTLYLDHRGHLAIMPHLSLRQRRDPVLERICAFINEQSARPR